MSKTSLLFILIILLAIFGGALWITKHPEILKRIQGKTQKEDVVTPTVTLASALPSKVSNEEMKKLAMGPGKDAKEADLKKYSETVNNASVISEALDISSCTPTPNILSFSPKQLLTVVNKDTKTHNISVYKDGKSIILSNVAPNSQTKTVINILKSGIYSYSCDGQGPAGMFLVQ